MKVYRNKYHNNHIYLSIEDSEVPHLYSAMFEELIEKHREPLQIMVSSDAEQLIGILEQSGFQLKRKCYEMDVCIANLAMPRVTDFTVLSEARRGSLVYAEIAEMMYAYYADTHVAINPLTATLEEFDEMLPNIVLYSKTSNKVDSAAFIDDNEIAYVFSYTKEHFFHFAGCLLAYMFSKFDRIVFESDDSDWCATMLKEMFSVSPELSYDMYIKTCDGLL